MHQETHATQIHPAPAAASTSLHQKSIVVSLVVIGATAIYYFVRAYELSQSEAGAPGDALGLAVGALIFIIVAETVLQAVLAIGAGQTPATTRQDREASTKAASHAYMVLTCGVFVTLGGAFLSPSLFVLGNTLLLFFVLAEITKLVAQLVYLRRPA